MKKKGFLQFLLRKNLKNRFFFLEFFRRARVASAFGYGDARASPAGGPQARPQ